MNVFNDHGQLVLTNGTVDVLMLPRQISRLIDRGAITELRDLAGNVIDWSDRTMESLSFTKQWRPIKKDACVSYTNCKILFVPIGEKLVFTENPASIMNVQTIWGLPYRPLLLFSGKSFTYLSADTISGLKLINPYMAITRLILED